MPLWYEPEPGLTGNLITTYNAATLIVTQVYNITEVQEAQTGNAFDRAAKYVSIQSMHVCNQQNRLGEPYQPHFAVWTPREFAGFLHP
jgi:hypothetical protein